jgi:hypothetical protein
MKLAWPGSHGAIRCGFLRIIIECVATLGAISEDENKKTL